MIRYLWPSRLAEITTEAQLVELINEYVGSWPFRDLEVLPLDCQLPGAIAADEIPRISLRVAEESLRLRRDSMSYSHLHDLCLFFAQALFKLMQLRG
jgi:hypothetical protein